MVAKGAGGLEWQQDALCAKPENDKYKDYFFSADVEKKYEAKNLCFSCPVREQCVKWALENGEIWGIWGGRDENEIRRTLSVNAEGNEVRRGRYPQCPSCAARTSKLQTKIIDLPDGGRWTTARVVFCTNCGFEWRSRSSANAVNAYYTERADKAAKAEKEKSKRLAAEAAKRELENRKALEVKPVFVNAEDEHPGV
jgi:WhiB family redox-sensing transcriptional regulator